MFLSFTLGNRIRKCRISQKIKETKKKSKAIPDEINVINSSKIKELTTASPSLEDIKNLYYQDLHLFDLF